MVNDSCLRGHHSFLRIEGDAPFVTANHSSLEHKQGKLCQVQVERTKYPGGGKKNCTKRNMAHIWKQLQLSWQVAEPRCKERNTSDSNWLLPSENRTRRKHYSTHTHTTLLSSALCASVHKKTWFSSYQTPECLTKHFTIKMLRPCKDVFLSSTHTVPAFVCPVNSSLKNAHVFHTSADILLPCLILGLFFSVRTCSKPEII